MFYYSLNISESYILNTTKPMKFDEFLKVLLISLIKKKDNLTEIINDLTSKGFVVANILPKSTGGQPIALDKSVPYKTVRFFKNQRIVMFIENNYEFILDLNHKLLVLSSSTIDYKMYMKQSNINLLGDILHFVRQYMSSLCEVVENSPQNPPVTDKAAKLGNVIEQRKKKFDKDDNVINVSDTIISESDQSKSQDSSSEDSVQDSTVEVKKEVNTVDNTSEHELQQLLNKAKEMTDSDNNNTDLAKGEAT